MVESGIKIIEHKEGYPKEVIKFLTGITTEEFSRPEWKDYFEDRLVNYYESGNNNFWIARDSENRIIGTCGALQDSEEVVKLTCFYIDSEYRGIGLGKELYKLFIEFVEKEKYKTVLLCTYKEFDRAIRFYNERGFKLYEIDGERNWYKKILL